MSDTREKIYLYKTAYSPLFETYVGIKSVREDDNGGYIIEAHVHGQPQDVIHLFRVQELTNYVL